MGDLIKSKTFQGLIIQWATTTFALLSYFGIFHIDINNALMGVIGGNAVGAAVGSLGAKNTATSIKEEGAAAKLQ